MNILNNIFSIFDPSCYLMNSSWITLALPLTLVIILFHSKLSLIVKSILLFISKEFGQSYNNINPTNLNFFITNFLLILLFNIIGLIPFSFTVTAQISISFSLAIIIMSSIWSFDWSFKLNNSLAHLTPIGAPLGLSPILVLIEIISLIIRPVTLSVRLAANIIAGHLLISILFSAISLINSPILVPIAMTLLMLEIAVSVIQAYVFSMLMILYNSEV